MVNRARGDLPRSPVAQADGQVQGEARILRDLAHGNAADELRQAGQDPVPPMVLELDYLDRHKMEGVFLGK